MESGGARVVPSPKLYKRDLLLSRSGGVMGVPQPGLDTRVIPRYIIGGTAGSRPEARRTGPYPPGGGAGTPGRSG